MTAGGGPGSHVARLREVSVRYGATVALDRIDVDMPAQGIVGVIGPDGVGKSTLFSLIAGARALQAGRLEVLGGDMADARHRKRVCPRIAYLPVEQREAMLAWLDHAEDGSAAPTVVQTARRAEVRWQDTPSHLDDFFHDEPAEPADMQAWLQPAAVKVLVPAGADNMGKTA